MDEPSYFDKLRTQIAVGEYPNIFVEYGGSRIIDYVESGLLLDLEPYLAADEKWQSDFLPLFENWQFSEHPGTFGIPAEFYAVTIFYNKGIFADAGINQVPETMADFVVACDKLLNAGYVPFALGEKDVWRAGHFLNNLVIKSFGSEGVTKLADRTMKYDDPEMIELYSLIKEFFNRGYFGDDAVTVDYNAEKALFANNKTAMHMDGSWFISEASGYSNSDQVGAFAFPTINPKYADSWQGGAGIGYSIIDTTPEENAAAIEVIKSITSQDFFQKLQEKNKGGVYPVKVTSDESVLDNITIEYVNSFVNAKEFRADIQNYDSLSSLLESVRYALQGLFIGNTPEECAKDIITEIQAYE
jgi:ABC-type glycerol-3-phosphate transport system substrate-binding protein